MSNIGQDGKLPRLLSLSVHEFRTPITVVAGYIRMLLKERAGALTEHARSGLRADRLLGGFHAGHREHEDLNRALLVDELTRIDDGVVAEILRDVAQSDVHAHGPER